MGRRRPQRAASRHSRHCPRRGRLDRALRVEPMGAALGVGVAPHVRSVVRRDCSVAGRRTDRVARDMRDDVRRRGRKAAEGAAAAPLGHGAPRLCSVVSRRLADIRSRRRACPPGRARQPHAAATAARPLSDDQSGGGVSKGSAHRHSRRGATSPRSRTRASAYGRASTAGALRPGRRSRSTMPSCAAARRRR